METSYSVRIWGIEERKWEKKTSYRVTWFVDNERFTERFDTIGLAESFRSGLVSAARKGEAFRKTDGLPVSMARTQNAASWFDFAPSYVDFKWSEAAPGHRRNMVEALATVTTAMTRPGRGQPSKKAIQRAMIRTLNPKTRDQQHDEVVTSTLRWLERNTLPVADLADAKVIAEVLKVIGRKQDGTKAAPSTFRRKRMTLTNALDYAVVGELLTTNPLPSVKITSTSRKAKPVRQIDRRSVANPVQARTLLKAVREVGKPDAGQEGGLRGLRLVAFFGALYYCGLRPEEAAMLCKGDLSLPEAGWGELHLEYAAPDIGAEWTDSGSRGEHRELKHRAPGEGRSVPCPPEQTELFHWHLETFGTAPDGRLFRGVQNGCRVSSSVYGRVWAKARAIAFTPEVAASPLAKRPYDLRHAWVSTLLAAGVSPAKVAEWAGHSLRVLMEVYAKVLDGGDATARTLIDRAFGH